MELHDSPYDLPIEELLLKYRQHITDSARIITGGNKEGGFPPNAERRAKILEGAIVALTKNKRPPFKLGDLVLAKEPNGDECLRVGTVFEVLFRRNETWWISFGPNNPFFEAERFSLHNGNLP